MIDMYLLLQNMYITLCVLEKETDLSVGNIIILKHSLKKKIIC